MSNAVKAYALPVMRGGKVKGRGEEWVGRGEGRGGGRQGEREWVRKGRGRGGWEGEREGMGGKGRG